MNNLRKRSVNQLIHQSPFWGQPSQPSLKTYFFLISDSELMINTLSAESKGAPDHKVLKEPQPGHTICSLGPETHPRSWAVGLAWWTYFNSLLYGLGPPQTHLSVLVHTHVPGQSSDGNLLGGWGSGGRNWNDPTRRLAGGEDWGAESMRVIWNSVSFVLEMKAKAAEISGD